jgi:ligand-binding sensor domain-containing protein/two-component sensor histidine kinase
VHAFLRSLILLPALASLHARRLPIKIYTTADGLARDRIQCIVQDRRGFMWFCTAEGLSRFDGYTFTNYGTAHGLPHHDVTGMVEGPDGALWAGTPAGLSRFDPSGPGIRQFRKFELPGDRYSQEIRRLYKDGEGVIWVGTWNGLFRLAKSASAFERVDLGSDAAGSGVINGLIKDSRGVLWVGTHAGLFRRDPGGRIQHLPGWPGFLDGLEDREGTLWVGGSGGLWRIGATSTPVQSLSDRWVRSILQSSTGKIWIGTTKGLAEWVPEARGTDREFEFYGGSNGVTGTEANVLAEDRDGNLWIGTDGSGVMRMAPSGLASFYAEDGLNGKISTGSIFETRAGELCFLEQSVVSRFDGRRFVPTRINFPRNVNYYGWGTGRLALQDRAGEWWIASGQGLFRFPPVTFDQLATARPSAVYRIADGLPSDNIFQLFEDSREDIWISSINSPKDGVALFERKKGRIRPFSEADGFQPPSAPTGFAEDRAGNVWAGTYHGTLARYRDGRFTMFTNAKGLPHGGWKVPYVDAAGRLWVADNEGGLARSDNPADPTPNFVTYTTEQGLASNDVAAVTEDLFGNIYAATGRGVDRIQPIPAGIAVTRHYTFADGLATGELTSAYRDRTGTLWFVTTLGISQLKPSPYRPHGAPPILITGLQIGTAAQPTAAVGRADVDGLRVQPGQGPLRIDFVGLSFAAGDTLRYQYQLDGVDHDWSAPTEQRSMVYGKLSSGSYRFLVRAVNSEGMISPQPASVSFTMLPPVWQSWWFLSLAGVAAGGLVYGAHRYRVRQLLAMERVRTCIATDLHDDIGSSLSQISILSELAHQRLRTNDPAAAQPLVQIATESREMVAALSDIVWAINPQHDRLSDLAARMRRFANDVLGGRGIVLRFHAEDERGHLRTNSHFRREVYLIFKEAVNNSAKHAGCTQADIEMHVGHGRLELHISDDGAGFEPAASGNGNGNGLENMRRRAAALRGEFTVRSEPGRGTDIGLSVPLPDSRTL